MHFFVVEKTQPPETQRNRGNGGIFCLFCVPPSYLCLLLSSVFQGFLLLAQSTLSSIDAVTSFFSMCRSMRWARNRRRSAPRLRVQASPFSRFNGARNISVAWARESAEISVLASRLSSWHS